MLLSMADGGRPITCCCGLQRHDSQGYAKPLCHGTWQKLSHATPPWHFHLTTLTHKQMPGKPNIHINDKKVRE